jgi:hypothetical protein
MAYLDRHAADAGLAAFEPVLYEVAHVHTTTTAQGD